MAILVDRFAGHYRQPARRYDDFKKLSCRGRCGNRFVASKNYRDSNGSRVSLQKISPGVSLVGLRVRLRGCTGKSPY